MNSRATSTFLSFIFFFVSTALGSFKANLSHTSGTDNYKGNEASAEYRLDLPPDVAQGSIGFSPTVNSYEDDTSSGSFKTYTGRVDFEGENIGAGLTLGKTPEINGYSNSSFGFDLSYNFILPFFREEQPETKETSPNKNKHHSLGADAKTEEEKKASEDGPIRLGFQAGYTGTSHSDLYQLLSSTVTLKRKRLETVLKRQHTLTILEKDVFLKTSLSVFDTTLSGQVTKSNYDKDLAKVGARSAQIVALAGVNSMVKGFPDVSSNVELDLDFIPIISPYVSYTKTSFMLDVPTSQSFKVGATVTFKAVDIEAAYENYDPGGGEAKLKHVTLGAGVKF